MSLLQALILGIVQGLSEFLPISSSGHLVIVPWLFGWALEPDPAFVFNILVQLGTMIAVIAYFFKDLVRMLSVTRQAILEGTVFQNSESRIILFVLLSTIPAVMAGLIFKPYVEKAFSDPIAVAVFLMITALIMFLSERLRARSKDLTTLSTLDALMIGTFQILALFPGMSRSGATISAGLGRGLDHKDAARYSFLMAIPIMSGAGAVALVDLFSMPEINSQIMPLVIGFLTAALVGYLSIDWLLSFLARRGLSFFSMYCLFAGLGIILVDQIRG